MVEEIQAEELEQAIDEGTSYIIIDVREDEEVANGMIPGAIHIPLNEIPSELDRLSESETYVIVCHSGYRSMNAAAFLENQGFDVKNLWGGMVAWNGELFFK